MTRVLGIDWGTHRVGVAISDPERILASPHRVVDRSGALDEIKDIVGDMKVETIVIGLPRTLSGEEGRSAEEARNFGRDLERLTGVDVVFRDERFTSRIADQSLLGSGMKRRDRRSTVDKLAAAIILQDYLDGRQ